MSSCEGTFDWVYDDAPTTIAVGQGQFYIDATDWKKWYFIDLDALQQHQLADSSYDAGQDVVMIPIPSKSTGDEETERGNHQRSGQYMYYFDVFGGGLKVNHFVNFVPTDSQPEPEKWTLAFHRNNVRTNGCSVYETTLTDINAVKSVDPATITSWTQDEWTENEVWDDQSTMFNCLVPSQGIAINKALSNWLTMEIPPVPPTFRYNNHVMLVKTPEGKYAALQLADYLTPDGRKCGLTIQYKYPL